MRWNKRILSNLLAGVLAGGLFLLPSGCGVSENAGTISGTVRYKGQPLSEGSVSFVNNNGQVATGAIDQAGRYVVSHMPVGSARVTVQVISSKVPPTMSLKEPKIPLRYTVAATSGLQHSVTKGKQQFDIDLKE